LYHQRQKFAFGK